MTSSSPTGCYKCGGVGHWSRDCRSAVPEQSTKAKPSTKSRSRPKLTADLVLSESGLGYVLEKLPRQIEIKGRGHETEDLGNLLHAYRDWHARLFPSLPFKRFIEEVEDLGSIKRVRMCLEDLRDKVAGGADLKECSSQLAFSQEDGRDDVPLEDAQRARMEVNRLQALERACARLGTPE